MFYSKCHNSLLRWHLSNNSIEGIEGEDLEREKF